MPDASSPYTSPVRVCNMMATESTDLLFLKFWETEEVSSNTASLTSEEKVVMNNAYVYLSTGRYKVALPRRTDVPSLGSRLSNIRGEREVKGHWAAFQEVVQEYLDLGHAKPVPKTSVTSFPNEHYYLPMYGVMMVSSTSRVLFDASTKTTSNVSLNDTLFIGPTLFSNLDHLLLRFRIYLPGSCVC